AGESQVGDLIELAKRAEDRQAHLVGVDLRSAGAADGLFDLLGEKRELVFTHRAALTGLPSAGDHLVATEGFHGYGPLHHRQARRLERGEAPPAIRALSAAPDRGAVFGGPGVDDSGVGV